MLPLPEPPHFPDSGAKDRDVTDMCVYFDDLREKLSCNRRELAIWTTYRVCHIPKQLLVLELVIECDYSIVRLFPFSTFG